MPEIPEPPAGCTNNKLLMVNRFLQQILQNDPYCGHSHTGRYRTVVRYTSKQLHRWFTHDGVKVPLEDLDAFVVKFNGGLYDFTALRKLPSVPIYEAVTEQQFIKFYEDQEKHGGSADLKAEAQWLYAIQRTLGTCYGTLKGNSSISLLEFTNYLFSESNSVLDPKLATVYEDMNRPLTDYWINSGHNSYLAGNQVTGDSSTECYATSLIYGVRCVELDCWDGDKEPVITHGHTMCSKVKFRHVISVIMDYAFVSSEYPLILSIENHCDIDQQRKMAQYMQEIFQDTLIKEPIDKNDEYLPSPDRLKFKVLLKGKKLTEVNGNWVADNSDDKDEPTDTGEIYILNAAARQWLPYYVALEANNTMSFNLERGKTPSESQSIGFLTPQELDARSLTDELMSSVQMTNGGVGPDVLGQPWFHGRVSREEANKWLKRYAHMGVGSYMVRLADSDNSAVQVSVLLTNEEVAHVKVCYEAASTGADPYYLASDPSKRFATMQDVLNYMSEPRVTVFTRRNNAATPTSPVPQRFENRVWYHPNMNRPESVEMLKKADVPGCFLVRPKDNQLDPVTFEPDFFVLSQLDEKLNVKHMLISADAYVYSLNNVSATSLVDLVEKLRVNPSFMLTFPLTEERAQMIASNRDKLQASMGRVLTEFTIDLSAGFEVSHLASSNDGHMQVLELACKSETNTYKLGFKSSGELERWNSRLRSLSKNLTTTMKKTEKAGKLAMELSNMVVYCQATGFKWANTAKSSWLMSSLEESKFIDTCQLNNEPLDLQSSLKMAEFLQRHFARIYPRGTRIQSSNYNPMPYWSVGAQIVALNMQTFDRPHQLNQGRFLDNGRCGFVPRSGGPSDTTGEVCKANPLGAHRYTIEVLCGRHMPRATFACLEVELNSEPWDKWGVQVYRVATKGSMSMLPMTKVEMNFYVRNPKSAILRFSFVSTMEQMRSGGAPGSVVDSSSSNLKAHAAIPVHAIRPGVRSLNLRGPDGSPMPLTSVLIAVKKLKGIPPPTEIVRAYDSDMSRTSSASTFVGADQGPSSIAADVIRPLLENYDMYENVVQP